MNKDWTDKLRDQLAAHEEPVSRDLWAGIEAELDGQPRRTRVVALRRWAVAAAVAALLGGGGLVWFKSLSEDGVELAQPKTAEMSGQKVPTSTSERTQLPEAETHHEGLLADALKTKTAVQKGRAAASKAHLVVLPPPFKTIADDESTVSADAEPAVVASEPVNGPMEKAVAEQPVKADVLYDDLDTELYSDLARLTDGNGSGQVSLGLYAQNGMANGSNLHPVLMEPAMAKNFNAVDDYGTTVRRGAGPIYLTDISEKADHKIPLSVGLSVAYGLTERLALQTGVTYTRAASEFSKNIRGAVIKTEQTLHYVGIPLQVRYNAWRWGNLNTYATAGGQMDVNVKAEIETEGVAQHMDKDRLQWSLSGGVGLQYDIAPQLGLYGEVGARWYPDNGSQVENYFKDKPFGVSFQVGLRLNVGKQDR